MSVISEQQPEMKVCWIRVDVVLGDMAVLDLAVLGYQLDSILEVLSYLNDSVMPYQAKKRASSSQCPLTVPPHFLH